MKNHLMIPMCLTFIMLPVSVFASSVVINELMFDPLGSDTGEEWIELYNASDEQVDVSGWEIYPDGIGYFTVPNGFSIGAKKFMLVHLRSSGNNSTSDLYQTAASSNMSNTSGSIAFFSAGTTDRKERIKSFVQWGRGGETWESDANKAGLWEKGTSVDLSSFLEGNSLALKEDGITANGKNAWIISGSPSPGGLNTHAQFSSASITPLPFATLVPKTEIGMPSPLPHPAVIKTIKVYAGEDISSMVGSTIELLGRSKGLNDESLDAVARFFWNFGDGETQEGRSVAHIYRMPGNYLAGLHVSSGEYAASDYIRVQISPNKVGISSVIPGLDGYMRIVNNSDIEADMSGWSIHDNLKHIFFVPIHTKMARHGDIALLNSVSGLFKEGQSLPVSVFYPNGVMAFTYAEATSTSEIKKSDQLLELSFMHESMQIHSDAPRKSLVQQRNALPIISSEPSISSSPSINAQDKAAMTLSPSQGLVPFGIAIGISMLGAIGFLISKSFL